MQIVISVIFVLLVAVIIIYFYLFYPQQCMPIGEAVEVRTIQPEKYHNDCLHPCIRYDAKSGMYFMAQSPDYGWNNKVENPMFYKSDDYMHWTECQLLTDTPKTGYNSDPNIYIEGNMVFFLWRECHTPLCDSLGCVNATVGGWIENGKLEKKHVLCMNNSHEGDKEQCPILIKYDGAYYIYGAWYQYEPLRKNKGIAIWKSESLDNPKFDLVETIPFESVYTVDKKLNIPLLGHVLYIPKPLKHDMWHFDLFEYAGKLYMVSVAEKGDNIMLSVAEDWRLFKTFRKPLVNNHYTENYSGYRQYFYKPTAFVKDDELHVFYTANAKDDPARNQLYHTALPAKQVLR